MYQKNYGQMSLLDNPIAFGGISLDPNNLWIKRAQLIPWHKLEEKYCEQFNNQKAGNEALTVRVSCGALYIQVKQIWSDQELVNQISMNPYLQFFLGLSEFTSTCPLVANTLVYFRKRISLELLEEMNEYIGTAQYLSF